MPREEHIEMKKRFVSSLALFVLLSLLTGCFITRFPGMSGYVTLPQAASRGDLVKVKELLDKGADPNGEGQYIPGQGTYALNEAAEGGHIEVMRLLIDRGAKLHL